LFIAYVDPGTEVPGYFRSVPPGRAMPVNSMPSAPAAISASEYGALVRLVYERCGITLGQGKQTLVTTRLAKRLRETGCASFTDYLHVLSADQGHELVHLMDAITTNTTSFFREPAAFEAVDAQVRQNLARGQRTFRFWSAASSTGMEAYTLAMLLAESGASAHDCAILATDISTRALSACREGIYPLAAVAPVPQPLRARYLRPVGAQWQIIPELRALLTVNRLNLSSPPFPMRGPFDAIFCRNVMIYFDQAVRQRLISACQSLLRPGGLLLIGAAESLHGLDHSFTTVRPAVYRR
jgi:chemotaxis protein methyltransferase CheR